MSETLTREGLIWKVASAIAAGEGKTINSPARTPTSADRQYIIALITEVIATVDGKTEVIATVDGK